MKSKMKYILIAIAVFGIVFINLMIGKMEINKTSDIINSYLKNRDKKNETYKIFNNVMFDNSKTIKKKLNLHGFSKGNVYINSNQEVTFDIFLNGVCYSKATGKKKITISPGTCTKKMYIFEEKKVEQAFVAPKTGKYIIELWGAAGGKHGIFEGITENYKKTLESKYGKGAYTKGTIYLEAGEILYVYVGGKGEDGKNIKDDKRLTAFGYPSQGGKGGYNGGGDGHDDPEYQAGGGGGGATDIRLISGKSDNFDSLKSRIMVAGAGAGMSRFYFYDYSWYAGSGESGSGGNLSGIDGVKKINNESKYGYGSTQTDGYKFGIGENGLLCMTTINGLGGGAGGYMGSRTGYCNVKPWQPSTGPGGGSSYVSGCKGCNSISNDSTQRNIVYTNKSTHYSNKKFTNIEMKTGEEVMPDPRKGGQMIGNNGDGFARITYIGGGK